MTDKRAQEHGNIRGAATLSGGTLADLWLRFVDQMEEELGQETTDRWLRSLKLAQSDEKSLHLEAKDSFQAIWFEEHIRHRLPMVQVPRQGTKPLKVLLTISGLSKEKKASQQKKSTSLSPKEPPNFHLEFGELDPTSIFDTFVPTKDNEIVVRLIEEMCSFVTAKKIASLSQTTRSGGSWNNLQGCVPNPMYIYGPSGSGKTHLLQATAHRLKRAGTSVIMANADLFTEHVVKSIRAGEMSYFRSLWRNADVLIVDDVHLLGKKSATQEEFFHTFNALHMAEKQLLFSANCLPQHLQFIEPRLVSRFEWGILLSLESLSKKNIPYVLSKKAEMLNFPLTPRQTEVLFSFFPNNVKSSVKALEALILRTNLSKTSPQKISPSFIKDLLSDLITEEEQSTLTPARIIAAVAKNSGVTPEDITGRSQSREVVAPRQMAIYLIRKHLQLAYMKIGEILGRDHSTVMSSVRHIEKQLSTPGSGTGSDIASIETLFSDSNDIL